ncbi:MAG: hypothetical protein FWG90_09175 [Oscillospiraceae bacterium]|nr:hypothetical protein [Oscillospiraceae bacterium]
MEDSGGMTDYQFDVMMRLLYLSARKAQRCNSSWEEYIAELRAVIGSKNVALVENAFITIDNLKSKA